VNIITEDPTCAAWSRAGREYADEAETVNWLARDKSVAAGAWNPEQRRMYDVVIAAMKRVGSRAEELAKQTPHRVMRELYVQFSAYVVAFAERVQTYKPEDNDLADVTDAIGNSLNNICAAIDFRSAQPIAPLIDMPPAPSGVAPVGDPDAPVIFLAESNDICSSWANSSANFDTATAEWRALNPKIPASDWTLEQRRINDAVAPIMSANADELEDMGQRSNNPTLSDFATLAAQYQRGLVASLPTYGANDNYLSESAVFLVQIVSFACTAASE
jgi:hypothetical protein